VERATGGLLAGLTSELLYQNELQEQAAKKAAQKEERYQQQLGKIQQKAAQKEERFQQKADRQRKREDELKAKLQAHRSPWRRFLRRLLP
jgi:transcription termination factor NusB